MDLEKDEVEVCLAAQRAVRDYWIAEEMPHIADLAMILGIDDHLRFPRGQVAATLRRYRIVRAIAAAATTVDWYSDPSLSTESGRGSVLLHACRREPIEGSP